MSRPKRPRTINSVPSIDSFRPDSADTVDAKEILLSLEEFEAIRLADFEGLDQAQASLHMGISRQTFGRVLRSARFIVSKALVKGLQLKVTGGCYQMRGHGRGRGRRGEQSRRRHHDSDVKSGEKLENIRGGAEMIENKDSITEQNSSNEGLNNNQNQGRRQIQGQRPGKCDGTGRGKGGGQRSGRGLGGGKRDGSCRRS